MGASLITGVVRAVSLSAISVVALTLVLRSAHVIATLLPVGAEKPQNFIARPKKNNIMTIMSRCHTAESRCSLESIIFPTSSGPVMDRTCPGCTLLLAQLQLGKAPTTPPPPATLTWNNWV